MLNRFPKRDQIVPVYAVGVTILFSWSIITTVKEILSNWSLYFNVVDILGLFSYVMAGAFLESLLLIMFLLAACFILPKKLLLDKFTFRGTTLVISILVTIMYYYTQTPLGDSLENMSRLGLFFVLALFLVMLGELFQVVDRLVKHIADSCIIFLYIYPPISFLSILTIIFRNLG